jgi:S2P endopeptidase
VQLCESILVHRFMHTYRTYRDAVPMHSAGFSLFCVLPSAFVSLSSPSLDALPPWPRIRIAAAGAWHNLIFWIILWLAVSSGLAQSVGSAIAWPFWRDVKGGGRAVIHVDIVSSPTCIS